MIRKTLSGLILLALAGTGALGAQIAADGPSALDADFDYRREADAVVLRYTQVLGEIAEDDPGPTVTIFGDGKTVVHYPEYMRGAGDYALTLSEAELRGILRTVLAKGLVDFDPEAVGFRKRELREQRWRRAVSERVSPEVSAVADAETTRIELVLERYRPPGSLSGRGTPITKTISWYGLAADVAEFPEIEALGELYEVETMLRRLMTDQSLKRVEE